jgi:hypothetical protein
MSLAPCEAQALVLRNLSSSWSRLAGQIDRYNALIREHSRSGIRKEPLRHSAAAALTDEMLKIVARGVDKQDTAWVNAAGNSKIRIPQPDGRLLVTLRDASDYIANLPKKESGLPEWLTAIEALMLVAERRPDDACADRDSRWWPTIIFIFAGVPRVLKKVFEIGIAGVPDYFSSERYLSKQSDVCCLGDGDILFRRDWISRQRRPKLRLQRQLCFSLNVSSAKHRSSNLEETRGRFQRRR